MIRRRDATGRLHTSRGFTIVELLIVIVVIAILAAITIVAYNGIQQRAKVTTASAELRNLSTKADLLKVDSGTYPWLQTPPSPAIETILRNANLWDVTRPTGYPATGGAQKQFIFCMVADGSRLAIIAFYIYPKLVMGGEILYVESGSVRQTTTTTTSGGSTAASLCKSIDSAYSRYVWSYGVTAVGS